MFQTDAQWECAEHINVLRELLQQPGLRRYPIVELEKNSSTICLDVIFKEEAAKGNTWTRYICSSLSIAIDVLTKHKFSATRLHIQICDLETRDYSIHPIIEIVMAADEQCDPVVLYRRRNGELYADGSNTIYNNEGLRIFVLWSSSEAQRLES